VHGTGCGHPVVIHNGHADYLLRDGFLVHADAKGAEEAHVLHGGPCLTNWDLKRPSTATPDLLPVRHNDHVDWISLDDPIWESMDFSNCNEPRHHSS
jgi:hypothetical protein